MAPGVALAHDYVTQRGGAERVALMLADAFPGTAMYTTLYEPETTFPEFAHLDVRTGPLNRLAAFRRHHRLAFPFLAPAVNSHRVEADVLVASSTGWAHGYRGASQTVVYCHAPARWLYQGDRYLGSHGGTGARARARRLLAGASLNALRPALAAWDRTAAHRADVYLANSTVTQRAIREVYGLHAEVLPPPPALIPEGAESAVAGIEPGFLLVVARLLPYKNVDAIVEAVNMLPHQRLVVVGAGPDEDRLRAMAGPRVQLLGRVHDEELRWLYRNAEALVAASYEDYGLSPLEAGAFGRPSVVLGDGGYLDTVLPDKTGVYFDAPEPRSIAGAIEEAAGRAWDGDRILAHVDTFAAPRFVRRLRQVVSGLSA